MKFPFRRRPLAPVVALPSPAETELPAEPPLNDPAVLGASYLSALYSDDYDLLECYRKAFSAEELLNAIAEQVKILARRVAMTEGLALQELGDLLVNVARLNSRHHRYMTQARDTGIGA